MLMSDVIHVNDRANMFTIGLTVVSFCHEVFGIRRDI